MKKNNPILLDAFDDWLAQASEESVRENCRTEGTVFFKYMAKRGVSGRECRSIVVAATGVEPRTLWRNLGVQGVRAALVNYYYSQARIDDLEDDAQRLATANEAYEIAVDIWEVGQ